MVGDKKNATPKRRKRRRIGGGVRVFSVSMEVWLTFLGFSDTLNPYMRYLALLLTVFLLVIHLAQAQSPGVRRMPRQVPAVGRELQARTTNQAAVRTLFGTIQRGIVSSPLALTSSQFAQQVFVNMSGGESGYFSANQAASILQRYFSSRTSLSFEFSRFSDSGSMPYATGRMGFTSRGRRESAQIYVSLRFQDSRWVISQFNIY